MRVFAELVLVTAAVVCFTCSSLAVNASEEGDEAVTKETMDSLRQEMAELKDLLAVLQNHVINHHVDSEGDLSRQAAEGSISKLIRTRRDSDSAVSPRRPLFTNISDTDTEDPNQSRILFDYHSTIPVGGTIYTHWGRSDCPDGAELVYTGTTAGAYYSHTGGGSHFLCLPLEPIYDEFETTAHASRSLVYSAEFETSTGPSLSDLHDQTPACAICRAPPTRLTKLVVPARNDCPSAEWRLEYKGYLMSSLYTNKARTDYICMDRDAEALPGTVGNQHGALFYHVEARCLSGGGLPCGPYVNGYELTCAVCTI